MYEVNWLKMNANYWTKIASVSVGGDKEETPLVHPTPHTLTVEKFRFFFILNYVQTFDFLFKLIELYILSWNDIIIQVYAESVLIILRCFLRLFPINI